MFESTVHKNTQLPSIDKFNYLVSLLEEQALRSIKGLAITEDNYQAAIYILQERFGNSQQIISAHMDELPKIQPSNGEKPTQLRYIYDKISVNVRGLEELGIHSEQYGSLLIPVVMSKLPAEVRLQMARKTEKDVWAIRDLLEIVPKEVEARELSEHVKANNDTKRAQTPRNVSSAASLVAQCAQGKNSFTIKRAFCGKQHYSASCEAVQKLSDWKDTLRKSGRCFVCLQFGHRGNQCSRKCGQCSGNHHQSICDKNPNLVKTNYSRDIEISALSFPKICAPLSITLDIEQYSHLEGLELADDNLLNDNTSADVDILIGSDYYYDIVTGEILRGDEGPCAVSTFGWLICGSAKTRNSGRDESFAHFVAEQTNELFYDAFFKNEQDNLTDVLSKF